MNKAPKMVKRFALEMPLVLAAMLGGVTSAHEVQDNRATLVLRDKTHVSLTVYLSYGEALRLTLAPDRPMAEFCVVYSAMRPEALRKELARAQSKVQAGTRLYLASGKELTLTNWVFPEAQQVQATLQRWVVQAVADGHAHEDPLEIRAEATSPEPVTSVRVQFPEEFQKVLVVAYRPTQLWVEPKSWSPAITF